MRPEREGELFRDFAQAKQDVSRVLRDGERVLASCVSEPVDNVIPVGPGGVSTVFIFVTNARLMWLSANNNGMVSIRWRFMTEIAIGRKVFQKTLTFSFSMPSWDSQWDYPMQYVSGRVARAINSVITGAVPTLEIPDEFVVAYKISSPAPTTLFGQVLEDLAKSMDIPGFKLVCSVCGLGAGYCSAQGDQLSDECEGCLRRFSGIVVKPL